MKLLEAKCSLCGELFVPADEDDLIHCVREDSEDCGGLGVIVGEYRMGEAEWVDDAPPTTDQSVFGCLLIAFFIVILILSLKIIEYASHAFAEGAIWVHFHLLS